MPVSTRQIQVLLNPVLLIQAPPEPDERRFYNAILEALFAPTQTNEKIDSRSSRVKTLLIDLDVKILMIDEIHHVLAGSPAKQRLFLNSYEKSDSQKGFGVLIKESD